MPEPTRDFRPNPPEAAIMAMYLIGGDVAIWNDARKAYPEAVWDFSAMDLQYVRGKDLSGVNLSNVVFGTIDLRDVKFFNADLTNTDFSEAIITPHDVAANFTGASMEGTKWPFSLETLAEALDQQKKIDEGEIK